MRILLVLIMICLGTTGVAAKDKALPLNWDKFYIGIDAAYTMAKGSTRDNDMKSILFDYNDHNTFQGATFGEFFGINQISGNFLYGLEGDVEVGGIHDFRVIGTGKYQYDTTINLEGSARARVGYVMGDVMAYATGGFAFANIDYDYVSSKRHFSGNMFRPGWTVGAGLEYKFDQHWTTRIEYRFTDLGVFSFNKHAEPTWLCDHHLTDHAVRIGVAFQF
jgi:outer membrane immunogenic protein